LFNRSGTTGGTGVGLSIAKAFVEAHGQEIWIEEGPTGGARFCFTMPPARITVVVP
jgi:signal transduction histidine kinase